MSLDAAVITAIFEGEGSSVLQWEAGTRCVCLSDDSKQPAWTANPPAGCECGGHGVIYASPVAIVGLFRSQSRFMSPRPQGELDHGEASLTTPKMPVPIAGTTYPGCQPGYTDRRVRDRFTVAVEPASDAADDRVFYPAAKAVPFFVGNEHLAWRVQLQSLSQINRGAPQP